MIFRRRKADRSEANVEPVESVEPAKSEEGTETVTDGVTDEPVADSVVLDELLRAFNSDENSSTEASEDADKEPESEPDKEPDLEVDAPAERATIAIGSSDDLPDAVYLDDELGRDAAEEGTVFIDDDGSSDAILPKDATSPGIEPRLRQRRIGVRRAESRRRLRWVFIGVGVFAVLIAGLAVLGSSLFSVDDVSVGGNVYTDPDALDAVVDDLRGTPVLLVDTGEAEERIEEIPWVEDARVRTDFPNRVTIEIRERTPVAAMLGSDNLARVLGKDGRVLEVVEGQPVGLVWISGPGTMELTPGEFSSIGYTSAASLVTKLTPTIRSRVDSMLVTPDGSDLVLILTSDNGLIEVRFGSAVGDHAQIEKLVRLERILEDLADESVEVIDVSTSEVTVR